MRKKTVVQIITRLEKGGSSENTLNICNLLNREKFSPVLIYGSGEPGDVDFTCIIIPELTREISPVKDITAFFKIISIFNKLCPDIIHTNTSKAGFIGRWAAWLYSLKLSITNYKLQKPKIVHTPHGHVFYGYEFSGLKSKLYLFLEIITAHITDKLLALTEGEKRESINLGIGNETKWEVVHCGIDINEEHFDKNKLRKQFEIGETDILIGTVARLVPVKGIVHFVEAISLLEKKKISGLKFIIVGDGKERQTIENKAIALGIFDKIVFTGMRNDVLKLMSMMDIYVQPSLNEGLGKTLVQAFSQGLPIVATNVQGIPDVVQDNVSGYLVPPSNPKVLADKISMLIENVKKRSEMGTAGKKWVLSKIDGYLRFSTERMLMMLENIYSR